MNKTHTTPNSFSGMYLRVLDDSTRPLLNIYTQEFRLLFIM